MNPKSNGKQASRVKEEQQSYGLTDRLERYEWIDGIRYDLQPAPTIAHQILVYRIVSFIEKSCQTRGIVLFAPVDVYFDEENMMQPDVIYVSNEKMHIVRKKRIEGTPDLLVEILSPSTSRNDKFRKKKMYAKFGVAEYWIVDPVHYLIEQFVLTGDEYTLAATYGDEGQLTSERFPCIDIDLDLLFQQVKRLADDE